MTTKTTTAKKSKASARKLALTSRAKMGAGRKAPKAAKPATPKAIGTIETLKDALVASIEQVAAQIPAGPGLDGDAGVPAAQIGEPVSPAKAKAKKAEPAAPQAGVTLAREPGRGWFHNEIDGVRVGMLFQTTKKGVRLWAASARPMGRDVRTEGANRQSALDNFVKLYRAS
jgi:hypothetical protein